MSFADESLGCKFAAEFPRCRFVAEFPVCRDLPLSFRGIDLPLSFQSEHLALSSRGLRMFRKESEVWTAPTAWNPWGPGSISLVHPNEKSVDSGHTVFSCPAMW